MVGSWKGRGAVGMGEGLESSSGSLDFFFVSESGMIVPLHEVNPFLLVKIRIET